MAATSPQIKENKSQFFKPPKEFSIVEQVLLSPGKEEYRDIFYDDYGPGDGSVGQVVRWNCFKKVLKSSFPSASSEFSTLDELQLRVPTSLYICLENLKYQEICPNELRSRLDNTKRLIEIIHQLRIEENLPLYEREALIKTVRILIVQGADPTVVDDNGWNILHVAAYFNLRDLVTWIRKGPDIDEAQEKVLLAAVTSDSDIMPAFLAKQRGYAPIYRQLSDMNNKGVAEADVSQTLSSCRL